MLTGFDFLNIPTRLWERTQPPSIRHPGSVRAFRDIRVLKLIEVLFDTRINIENSETVQRNGAPTDAVSHV